MRLAFLGTPEAAVPSLRALVAAGHDVAIVITRPDRRRGRGSDVSSSPVKAAAESLGLTVGHRVADLEGLTLDLGVVVAYGAMIPADVLARVPMLNVHFSLLPRWRGAAPVERAILAGDVETGVGIMSLEETLDTGPLHGEARVPVDEKTASTLTAELAEVGAALLVEVVASPERLATAVAQEGEPTYAAKLNAETFHLQPSMTVEQVRRVVRLERAFLIIGSRRVRILEVAPLAENADGHEAGTMRVTTDGVVLYAADGGVRVVTVHPEGSKKMPAAAWWSGARLVDGATWA